MSLPYVILLGLAIFALVLLDLRLVLWLWNAWRTHRMELRDNALVGRVIELQAERDALKAVVASQTKQIEQQQRTIDRQHGELRALQDRAAEIRSRLPF